MKKKRKEVLKSYNSQFEHITTYLTANFELNARTSYKFNSFIPNSTCTSLI